MRLSAFAAALGAVLLCLTPHASLATDAVPTFGSESWQEITGAYKGANPSSCTSGGSPEATAWPS